MPEFDDRDTDVRRSLCQVLRPQVRRTSHLRNTVSLGAYTQARGSDGLSSRSANQERPGWWQGRFVGMAE